MFAALKARFNKTQDSTLTTPTTPNPPSPNGQFAQTSVANVSASGTDTESAVDLDLLAQTQRVILNELENHGQHGWSQSEDEDDYFESPIEVLAKKDLEELDTLLAEYLAAQEELSSEEN